ncbi:MAG: hypothetical protein ACPLPX_09980 [Candidatus Kapaibacteriota bacterium]
MKKIYFALLFALLSGLLSWNKASGQCDVCPQPNLCYIISFDLPNCPGVQAVICYTCAVTHLEAYFEIYLRNVCAGMEDEAYEYARRWVLENFALLCGNTPCHIRRTLITFTRPICGRVEVVDGRINIYKGEGECYKQCIEVWEWCWCVCDPAVCWESECEEPNQPQLHWQLVGYTTEGEGNCSSLPYPPSQDCTLIKWRECGEN